MPLGWETNTKYTVEQVCLMSQSWDNVASMHDHLLIVHARLATT